MDNEIELKNIRNILNENDNIEFLGIKLNKNISIRAFGNKNYYIIGNDYEDEIGINIETLELYTLSNKTFYLNNSFDKFIKCVKYFMENLNLEEDYIEDERHKQIKEIQKGIQKIDETALSNENNWWSLIIEQADDGIL
ncbi:MAG: SUKH-4 family immunity protein [Azoarcus sp.]|jgi:CTP:phosphocholine cytidylyltransferase-like protein|nr:SUKH-4 family immunity protein [Azoarcus sp.]